MLEFAQGRRRALSSERPATRLFFFLGHGKGHWPLSSPLDALPPGRGRPWLFMSVHVGPVVINNTSIAASCSAGMVQARLC